MTVVENRAGAAGEDHLFERLRFEPREMFLVGIAERGEEHGIGADDAFEPLHFARLRDARLEEGQLLVPFEHQHREGYAELRIVAFGRAVALDRRGQLFGDPLLDDGLAVRARDADHRAAEEGAVIGGPALQRLDGVAHDDAAAPFGGFDVAFDQKGAHAAAAHLVQKIVRIVVGAAHRHEEGSRAQLARERTRIGHHGAHLRVGARETAAHDGGDL